MAALGHDQNRIMQFCAILGMHYFGVLNIMVSQNHNWIVATDMQRLPTAIYNHHLYLSQLEVLYSLFNSPPVVTLVVCRCQKVWTEGQDPREGVNFLNKEKNTIVKHQLIGCVPYTKP